MNIKNIKTANDVAEFELTFNLKIWVWHTGNSKTLSFKNWLKLTQIVAERGLCILGLELAAKLYKLHRLITIIKPWIEEKNSIYLRLTQWNFNKESIDIRLAIPANDTSKAHWK